MAVLAFYTRHLTKLELSLLPIYEMLGGMSTLFFGFGLLPSFIRSLPSLLKKDIDTARSIILTGAAIILTGTVFYSILVFLFSKDISILLFHSADYIDLVNIMAFACFVIGLKKVTYHLMWANSSFRQLSVLNVIQSIMNASITLGLFFILGLKGILLGFVLSDITYSIVALYLLKKVIFSTWWRFYPAKKLLKESWPFYFEGYLTYFRSQGDNWIVTTFLGPSSLVIYYIAKKIYNILLTMLESTDKVITSNFARYKDDSIVFQKQFFQSLAIICYAVSPMVFLVIGLSPSAILVLAGHGYMDAVLPSIILCFAILILFIRIPLGRAIFILMSPKYRLKITILESFCILFFLLVLTPFLREKGVALSRCIASIISGLYAYFLLSSLFSLKVFFKDILKTLIAPMSLACCLLVLQFINFKLILLPIYFLASVLLFLILVGIFYRDRFYRTINILLPFEIPDPLNWASNIIEKMCK